MKTKDADQIAEAVLRKASALGGQTAQTSVRVSEKMPPKEVIVERIDNGFLVRENDYQLGPRGAKAYFSANLDELPAILKKVFK